jgi:formate hydrogenlyase subunit 4
MTLLTALLSQILHAVLVAAAVPVLAGMLRWGAAGFAETPAALIRREHAMLRRLWRKTPLPTEPSAPLLNAAPAIAAGLTAVVALITPSFALGMGLSPLADLLTIAGLLGLARVLPLLACMDGGSAAGGVTAQRHVSRITIAAAALPPAILALGAALGAALGGGGLTLDQIGAARFDDALVPGAARGLAAAAIAAIAVADMAGPGLDDALSGPTLALTRVTEALRLLVWCNLVLLLAAPLALVGPDSALADWPLAVLSWIARLGVLAGLLAGAAAVVGPPAERWLPPALMLAGGLAVLAAILALTHAGAA